MAAAVDRHDVPLLVLGKGSNLLVADAGFAGLVVSLGRWFRRDRHRGLVGAGWWGGELPGPGPAERRQPG